MPLPTHIEKAQVIITKLQQPHRFDYAMQCACGFQHHGFAAQGADPAADMEAAAAAHLIQKHGVAPVEASDFIEVTPFTTVGGASHDQLKAALALHAENPKAASPVKIASASASASSVENIKVTTPPQSQPSGASKEDFNTAKPVSTKIEDALNVPQNPNASAPNAVPTANTSATKVVEPSPVKPPATSGSKLNEFPIRSAATTPVQPGVDQPATSMPTTQVQPGGVKK